MRPLPVLTMLLVGSVAFAQSERYELGARLKGFEAEWEKQTDKDARKRALKGLPDVTGQFFSFQFGKAGQTLDTARFALQSDKPPSDAVLWATSLYPEVKTRLVAANAVEVRVKQFYKTEAKRPDKVSLRCGFGGETSTTVDVEKVPATVTVLFPERLQRPADLTLTMEVLHDGKPLAVRTVGVTAFSEQGVAAVARVAQRVAKSDQVTLESETQKARLQLLLDLADGVIPESDVLAAKLILQAVTDKDDVDNGFRFDEKSPGDHWLTVPTGKDGKTLTPCRLFVPEKLDAKKPVPLVVAMHGAGGSENLFFEGYGNGHVVKLCKERGWLLVSPRAGLGFGLTPAPPVGDIIDVLAKRYPVDAKRVFIVGHSMGSSMALDAVQKHPGKFAAAACLGGGGRVRDEKALDGLPVFVGVGDQDFALKTAKSLHTTLGKTKAKVTFKEYADVEHLLIVREALGDVFDQWDKIK